MQTENSGESGASKVIAIEIHERLDLSVHGRFVQACRLAALPGSDAIELDVGRTRDILDSGLAMLLMLHRCAGPLRNRIRLVNCSPEMRSRLQAHKMDTHFQLT
jgi:hypothetical protein